MKSAWPSGTPRQAELAVVSPELPEDVRDGVALCKSPFRKQSV